MKLGPTGEGESIVGVLENKMVSNPEIKYYLALFSTLQITVG